MIRKTILAATAVSLLALAGAATAQSKAPTGAAAAVSDPKRPAEDTARDAERKPAEMLAFAEVKPGETIAELIPGRGYFTRLFSKAVGPQGHVYAVVPEFMSKGPAGEAIRALAADPAYANVTVVPGVPGISLPQKADLIWTSLNYHDFHLTRANTDVAAVNKAIFEALKPGGLYVIVDHAAAAGTGLDVPDKLHRIDPAIVRREVQAAGFTFVSEDSTLRNPADDHTKPVFDPAIRGHTDQFVLKFRKPR